MPEPATKPLRADAARNLTAILRAARAAFEEEGVDVGVDQIARRAGVGKGTLYRRFPTKEDLVWAVMEDAMSELEAQLDEQSDTERDPWEAFEAFMESAVRFQADNRGFFQSVMSRFGGEGPPEGIHERALAVMERQLTRAQEAGVVRDDLTASDLGAVLKMIGAAQPANAPPLPEEVWKRYLALMLDGLRAGAGDPLPGRPMDLKSRA